MTKILKTTLYFLWVVFFVLLVGPLYAQEVPLVTHTWEATDGPVDIPAADLPSFGQTAGRMEVTWTPTTLLPSGSQQLMHIPNHLGLWVYSDGVHGEWFNDAGERRLFRARWGLAAAGQAVNIVITWNVNGYAVLVDGVLRVHDWQTLPSTVYPDPDIVSGIYGGRVGGTESATGSFVLNVYDLPASYNPCLVDVVGTINENIPLDNTGSWSQGIDPRCGAPTGTAELSWTPPTENDDGTALTDLAGYKIYQSTVSGGPYTLAVDLPNPALTSYTVTGLANGQWHFVATSYNVTDVESVYSNETTKTVASGTAPNPPGGLTVVGEDLSAYVILKLIDDIEVLQVGTVPLGTVCDPEKYVNGYNIVPWEAVIWASSSVRSKTVVAKCG
jgi:hypothetical protein